MPHLCGVCGKRSATHRRRARLGLAVPTCDACLITFEVASRSCPPRYSESPAELLKEAKSRSNHSMEMRTRQWRMERAARSLLEVSTTGRLASIVRGTRRVGGYWDGKAREFPNDLTMWDFEMLIPEVCDLRSEMMSAARRMAAAFESEQRESRDLELRSKVVESASFGFDNPLEDPEFIQRLLDGFGEDEGSSGRTKPPNPGGEGLAGDETPGGSTSV